MTPDPVDTAPPSIAAPQRRWLPMLICAIGYFALAALGIWLARQPGSVATLWLPNAFCLGLLLHRPRTEAPWLLAGMAGANLAANCLFVDGLGTAVLLAGANLFEVAGSAWLLRFVAPMPARNGWARSVISQSRSAWPACWDPRWAPRPARPR